MNCLPPAIRTARPSEREALEALQWRASLSNPGDREAILAHPDATAIPPAQMAAEQVFVAERDSLIVGFAAILTRDDGDTELDGLFVEPDHWRGGIGRALVEHCSRIACINGSRYLHVVGNPHAEGFYLACGFIGAGVTETRFGPGLAMRRKVSLKPLADLRY